MKIAIIELHNLDTDIHEGVVRVIDQIQPVTIYRVDVASQEKMEIDCLYYGLKFIREQVIKFGGIEWYSSGQFQGAFYHEDLTEYKRVFAKRVDEEVKIEQ